MTDDYLGKLDIFTVLPPLPTTPMDTCFQDVVVEFLGVAFHNILYYTSVYPKVVFETRRKYNVLVHSCIHPEINQYLNLSLKSIQECLKNGQLYRVVFAVTNSAHKPLIRFVFDLSKSVVFDETSDAYLIQAEQNMRAFCLLLSSNSEKFKNLPEDSSFIINIHTNESTAVNMTTNSSLDDFLLVEIEETGMEADSVIPLRSFSVRGHQLETYIEL